ncbi:MAG: hypothetical protein OH318_01495 [Candidatus Parvarchaeota archaeon]|nr:hypothetical protein [Candidatus Rehaiarchaeum fermentans]
MCNKEESEKNVRITKEILDGIIEVSKDVMPLFEILKSYANDAIFFHNEGKYDKSVECSYIVWAYTDALLHLNKIKVKESIINYFTV